jgi:hypothetical protein
MRRMLGVSCMVAMCARVARPMGSRKHAQLCDCTTMHTAPPPPRLPSNCRDAQHGTRAMRAVKMECRCGMHARGASVDECQRHSAIKKAGSCKRDSSNRCVQRLPTSKQAVEQACGVVARGRERRTHIEQDMHAHHVCEVQVFVCANDTECGDRWGLRVQLIESKCQLARSHGSVCGRREGGER